MSKELIIYDTFGVVYMRYIFFFLLVESTIWYKLTSHINNMI